MTVKRTPRQILHEAEVIALANNCYITEATVELVTKRAKRLVTKYTVWRRSYRPTRIGTRSSPAALRALVCKAVNFK